MKVCVFPGAAEGGFPEGGLARGQSAVFAFPYGNDFPGGPEAGAAGDCGVIAPFARFNYYREAVRRLKRFAAADGKKSGGGRRDYRIFCNSRAVNEKAFAVRAGLGFYGRNGLVIVPPYGSLVVLAVLAFRNADLSLPDLPSLPPLPEGDFAGTGGFAGAGAEGFPLCADCDGENPPCKAACPTGASGGDGRLNRALCIQWYASGHGSAVPDNVKKRWGRTLYGCTKCQDACPHNQKKISGIKTELGRLPACISAGKLLGSDDEEIRLMFRGSALGLSWPGPAAIRRNASLVLQNM